MPGFNLIKIVTILIIIYNLINLNHSRYLKLGGSIFYRQTMRQGSRLTVDIDYEFTDKKKKLRTCRR